MTAPRAGWYTPLSSGRAHYWRAGAARALCGRYRGGASAMTLEAQQGTPPSPAPHDCPDCHALARNGGVYV